MARTPFRITDMRVLGSQAPQTGDVTPPSTPQNVVATAINAGRVDVSWTASTDDFSVSGYQIFRNGSPLTTTALTSYSDTTCQPSTAYSYVIVAFDGAGHNSAASSAGAATTPPNAAPVWQSIPAQTLIVGNAYLLQLTTYCTDADLDTLTFAITAGTLPSGIVLNGSRLQGTPTTAGQSPTVTVRAADAFHQISTTVAFSTYDSDVTAPPIPTGLAVAVVSTSQFNISWNASVDLAGAANELVTGTKDYRIYRDGVLRTTVTAPTLTHSETGLSAGTTYGYTITARDQNNNESAQSVTVSGTTLSTGLFNPAYPRFGSYALGGTQNASNSALAQSHVNIISYYPGWEGSRGSLQSKVLAVKALSSIGSMVIPYTIAVDALDAWATPPQAMWEWYTQLTVNQWFVYTNGLTHTGKVVGSASGWSKPNYTTSCPLVAGDTAARWKAKWDLRLLYTGGTFSNGTSNLTVTACNAIDGKFDDNIFARERSNGDYTVDGVSEAVSSAGNISLIQASHGVNADYWRTLAPSGSMLLANSADWPILYPAGVTGLAFDQKYDGGLMENLEEWINGVRGSTLAALLNTIKVQMDGYRGSKLGVMDVTVSSATNYSSLRFWHCVSALTGAYLYTHLTSGLLAEELGTINYDERTFALGAATEAAQYTARYQSGANGRGIYRRDFDNGIVLVFAQDGTATNYTAQALGGTFYRLVGSLDATTNNGASLASSPVMAPGTALVLARVTQETGIPANALYVDPVNGNDANAGTTSSRKRTIAGAWAAVPASGGGYVILGDGSYGSFTSASLKAAPSWVAKNVITAEHDGSAVFTNFTLDDATSWFCEVRGLKCTSTSGHDVATRNLKVFRTAFLGGPASGNASAVNIGTNNRTPGANLVLLEDCWAGGFGGRYKFLVYNATNVVLRRCLSRFDGFDTTNIAPEADITVYDSQNVAVINCVTVDCATGSLSNGFVASLYNACNGSTSTPNQNRQWLGNVVINTVGYYMGTEGQATMTGLQVVDGVGVNCADYGISQLIGNSNIYNRIGLSGGGGDGIGAFGGSQTTTNCIVRNKTSGQAFNGVTSASSVSFGNSSNNGGSTVLNPLTNGWLYPTRIETGSVLASGGTSGGQRGPNIRNKLGTSGTLYGETGYTTDTGESLWPYPNEARIKADLSTVTGVTNPTRGFCAASETLTHYIMNQFGSGNPY